MNNEHITMNNSRKRRTPSRLSARVFLCSLCFIAHCTLFVVHSYAQDRSRLSVFVAPPTGGGAAERNYFLDQFRMELIGANYPSVETKEESTYTLFLNISENENYDPRYGIDDTNRPWLLGIRLVNSKDDTEIVSFNFAFTDIDQMADWNLYLLYQALANAYVPDTLIVTHESQPPGPADERWRNQTFYVNAGLGLEIGSFLHSPDNRGAASYLFPTVLAGFEWHFLSFLSLEVELKAHMIDNGGEYNYFLGVPLLVKGVFKPGTLMLEPYAGAEPALSFGSLSVPFLSVTGGIQLGSRAGERSAWVLDVGLTKNLIGQFTYTSGNYDLLRVHFIFGYKFGFKERAAPKVKAEAEKENA